MQSVIKVPRELPARSVVDIQPMLAEVPLEGVFEVVMIAVEVALKVFEFVRRHVEDAREHSTQSAIVVLSWIMRSPVEIAPKDIEVA